MKQHTLILVIGLLGLALLIAACGPSVPGSAPVITTTPAAAPPVGPTLGVASPTVPVIVVPTTAPTTAPTTTPTTAATSVPPAAAPPSGTSPTVAPNVNPTPGAGAACRNNSAFVSDVTVPDGTQFTPGQQFTKTWRVQNTGTCAWGDGYQLVFERGTNMSPNPATVPATAPGASADVTLTMTAPTNAGSYIGYWRLRTPNATAFGINVWASIRVATTPAAAPTVAPAPGTACTNNSTFVADITIPDGALMSPGQQFNKIWRISNSGTCAWGDGYTLAFVSGTAMTTQTSVAVPSVQPGQSADLQVTLAAPSTAGSFRSNWRLKAPDGTAFGHTVWAIVRVTGAPAAAPPLVPGAPGATLDDPTRAFLVGSPLPSLAPGTAQWVHFFYNNADEALPRPSVMIVLANGVTNGLTFEVYSPETLVPNWAENKPVGKGTREILTNCIEAGVNVGQCPTNNLTWTGGFGLSGTHYVRIINPTNTAVAPQLTISGPGLAPAP